MTKKTHRPSLGRGLSALISTETAVPLYPHSDASASKAPPVIHVLDGALSEIGTTNKDKKEPSEEGLQFIDINRIHRNPKQPRKDFKEAELDELAQSMKELGMLQPVLLRAQKEETASVNKEYEIVAGERRWRAAQRAGLDKVPAIVRELSDKESLEISIVENVQRENLNPIEEARAYELLSSEFHLSHSEIAERVAKDRSTIANMLRLLKLPDEILNFISEGKLSIGHAKAILGVKEIGAQISLAKKAIKEALSVRDLETIVARVAVLDTGRLSGNSSLDSKTKGGRKILPGHFGSVEDELRRILSTRVAIRHKASGRGRIEIEYFSEEELGRIVELLLRH
ncbi:MAG: ParB/RepB/Spo0J family partition protein [SAR324 cluster bacterium]|uniref:ParB/RepB/Spo0J family partition protein n=1 Tax=SAR324 cluster bacterium TaxID=2024889 RepID=A0A7X9FU93_9DELT|nr:ParB/RepB/Spo0J family partition protein [SAR324 cluster bacterium]